MYTHVCVQIVKKERKSYIINISKEYSIVSQFTSFVAIEEREKVHAHVCTSVDAHESIGIT